MDWSFQLYSARNFQPWNDVLAMVAREGYRQVEGFGGVYGDPAGLRAELDARGLSMPTGHFGVDALEGDFGGTVALARTLGVKLIVCPFLMPDQRPSDRAGWSAFAGRLARIGEKCKAEGFGFAWHNHDFEFATLGDGAQPMKVILDEAPDIGWQADIAWVARGGEDPLAWIEAYGPRIVAVHVKDLAPQGEAADEGGWADVGHGVLDWPHLLKALKEATPARYFIMEHDNPSDVERFARRSIASVQAW